MNHKYEKGIVKLNFIRKNGNEANVYFPMDKTYYDDICKLNEDLQEKYLLDNYIFYYKEKYQNRKHSLKRDRFINVDLCSVENIEVNHFSQQKIQMVSNDPEYEKKTIIKHIVKALLNELSSEEKYIITQTVMYSKSNVLVAKELGLNESTVRRRKKNIINKIKKIYKLKFNAEKYY